MDKLKRLGLSGLAVVEQYEGCSREGLVLLASPVESTDSAFMTLYQPYQLYQLYQLYHVSTPWYLMHA